MLRCRAAGDDEQFFTIALQVAAAEARQGHRTLAEGIRGAVEKARGHSGFGQTVAVPFAAPRGDLADLIELRNPSHRLDDVVLNVQPRGQIDDLIREQTRRDWLREHGKTPSQRILFVGPPGSGKTMTAEALAAALKLPLFVIRLEVLITRFMGETAAKLRLVFDETAKRRGVYLFDEFDAVGGHRSASQEGELTPKGKPRRKGFVEAIESIRQAHLETFWTDDVSRLPPPGREMWWEIWCLRRFEDDLEDLIERLGARAAERERRLYFPEHVVLPVLADRATIELMLFARRVAP